MENNDNPVKPTDILFKESLLDRVDDIADETGKPVTEVANNALRHGLEELHGGEDGGR